MTTTPRVSVIVPAYNSAEFIASSLISILEQTYRDYEIIVVDDGSTDETKQQAVAVSPAVRYIYQANGGPSLARNTGIAAARGSLICFLDADDLWLPGKLAAQVECMDRNPAAGLIFSDEEEFDERGVQCRSLLATSRFYPDIVESGTVANACQRLLVENFIPTSTVMIRRDCFSMVGLFDPLLKASEDRDLWSRIAASFPIVGLRDVHGRKRVVASSVSRDVEKTLRSRIRLWTKARELFPELAPRRTVNALLATTYVHLGYVLLRNGSTSEARRMALKTLAVSRAPREWLLAASLVALSWAGTSFAASLFAAKRRLAGPRSSAV
jgi:glycosyltransferase involved in cell wall biosynthesis